MDRHILTFPSDSPALNRKNDHLPSHQEAHHAHGDGVHEHGVKVVMYHSVDSVLALMQLALQCLGLSITS